MIGVPYAKISREFGVCRLGGTDIKLPRSILE